MDKIAPPLSCKRSILPSYKIRKQYYDKENTLHLVRWQTITTRRQELHSELEDTSSGLGNYPMERAQF
jgi:hypothetical protein